MISQVRMADTIGLVITFTLVATQVSCCGRSGFRLNSRIVAGNLAEPGQFPWIVSLQVKDKFGYRHICGGAILKPEWIISAGHCIFEVIESDLSVVAGDHNLYEREGDEQRKLVSRFVTSSFDVATFENDVSLIKLFSPFEFNEKVSAICLPRAEDIFYGYGTVAGWGRVEEDEPPSEALMHINIPFIRKSSCDQKYRRMGFSRYLHTCQLCAGYTEGGKDACQGDSGGPLMCKKDDDRYYVCGIVSWGVGCARPGFPGIYVKVNCLKFGEREFGYANKVNCYNKF